MYRNYVDKTKQARTQIYNLSASKFGLTNLLQNLWVTPKSKRSTSPTKQARKLRVRNMETEFVTVNNVPVRVDVWGGCLPNKILEDPKNKPEDLILVVPGNPGVTKFYYKFINEIYERTKKPIWLISHGGHDRIRGNIIKVPSLRRNKQLYDLNGQIKQKKELIEKYLEGVKLTCIGHSIGCKMLLELMKTNSDIEKCYFLFPTLERMAETRNGEIVIRVIKYILWLTLFGSYLFVYLPKFLQFFLLRVYCMVTGMSTNNMGAIIELIDPYVLNQVFFLANDEMNVVRELDDDALEKHGSKLRLYYGASDGWTPLNYFEDLKKKHPTVKAEVCEKGAQHAFVLEHSVLMAEQICSWLTLKT